MPDVSFKGARIDDLYRSLSVVPGLDGAKLSCGSATDNGCHKDTLTINGATNAFVVSISDSGVREITYINKISRTAETLMIVSDFEACRSLRSGQEPASALLKKAGFHAQGNAVQIAYNDAYARMRTEAARLIAVTAAEMHPVAIRPRRPAAPNRHTLI